MVEIYKSRIATSLALLLLSLLAIIQTYDQFGRQKGISCQVEAFLLPDWFNSVFRNRYDQQAIANRNSNETATQHQSPLKPFETIDWSSIIPQPSNFQWKFPKKHFPEQDSGSSELVQQHYGKVWHSRDEYAKDSEDTMTNKNKNSFFAWKPWRIFGQHKQQSTISSITTSNPANNRASSTNDNLSQHSRLKRHIWLKKWFIQPMDKDDSMITQSSKIQSDNQENKPKNKTGSKIKSKQQQDSDTDDLENEIQASSEEPLGLFRRWRKMLSKRLREAEKELFEDDDWAEMMQDESPKLNQKGRNKKPHVGTKDNLENFDHNKERAKESNGSQTEGTKSNKSSASIPSDKVPTQDFESEETRVTSARVEPDELTNSPYKDARNDYEDDMVREYNKTTTAITTSTSRKPILTGNHKSIEKRSWHKWPRFGRRNPKAERTGSDEEELADDEVTRRRFEKRMGLVEDFKKMLACKLNPESDDCPQQREKFKSDFWNKFRKHSTKKPRDKTTTPTTTTTTPSSTSTSDQTSPSYTETPSTEWTRETQTPFEDDRFTTKSTTPHIPTRPTQPHSTTSHAPSTTQPPPTEHTESTPDEPTSDSTQSPTSTTRQSIFPTALPTLPPIFPNITLPTIPTALPTLPPIFPNITLPTIPTALPTLPPIFPNITLPSIPTGLPTLPSILPNITLPSIPTGLPTLPSILPNITLPPIPFFNQTTTMSIPPETTTESTSTLAPTSNQPSTTQSPSTEPSPQSSTTSGPQTSSTQPETPPVTDQSTTNSGTENTSSPEITTTVTTLSPTTPEATSTVTTSSTTTDGTTPTQPPTTPNEPSSQSTDQMTTTPISSTTESSTTPTIITTTIQPTTYTMTNFSLNGTVTQPLSNVKTTVKPAQPIPLNASSMNQMQSGRLSGQARLPARSTARLSQPIRGAPIQQQPNRPVQNVNSNRLPGSFQSGSQSAGQMNRINPGPQGRPGQLPMRMQGPSRPGFMNTAGSIRGNPMSMNQGL